MPTKKSSKKKKKLTRDEFIRMLEKKPTKEQLKRLKVLDFIDIYGDDEHKDNILLADGLDEAFLGLAHRDGEHGKQVAVYGIYSCIYTLQWSNKWTWEEAEEYFHHNTRWTYVGEYTPMYIEEMMR
jgi:hypothetical protein